MTIDAVSRRPEIDAERVAIDGYSLGGFISLSAAQECLANKEVCDVRAVVVNWGTRFAGTEFADGSPPTMFVHGEVDTIVPLESAKEALGALQTTGAEVELYVVPNAGHRAFSEDANRHRAEFFAKHLRPEPSR